MEGRRRNQITRAERGRRQRRAEVIRFAWWVSGFVLVTVFMMENNLMNVTGVLAVLGVIEVVAKAWKHIGDKVSGGVDRHDKT